MKIAIVGSREGLKQITIKICQIQNKMNDIIESDTKRF